MILFAGGGLKILFPHNEEGTVESIECVRHFLLFEGGGTPGCCSPSAGGGGGVDSRSIAVGL